MKPDCLTPEQWAAALAMSATPMKTLSRRMGRGFLRCANCDKREGLTATLVEKYFREGWPKCCEGTAHGGTMNFHSNEDQLRRELALVEAR